MYTEVCLICPGGSTHSLCFTESRGFHYFGFRTGKSWDRVHLGNPTPFRELVGLQCYCCICDFTTALVSERTAGITRGPQFSSDVHILDYSLELSS